MYKEYDSNESIGYLASSVHKKLSKRLTDQFLASSYGVSPEQWWILLTISKEKKGALSQSQIAKCHQKDRAGIKRLIDQLELKGLVVRSIDGSDPRANRIELTEKGFEACSELSEIARSINADAVKVFSDFELNLLKELLRKLLFGLD